MITKPIVLSIAGYDPCGGAGVLSDVKTFERIGVKGMAVTTCITYQNESEFDDLDWLDIEQVKRQIQVLLRKYSFSAIKIGLIPFPWVNEIISMFSTSTVVIWDPILKASAGFDFKNDQQIDGLKNCLKRITLLTPNEEEFSELNLGKIESNVLIKTVIHNNRKGDLLHFNKGEIVFFPNQNDGIYYPKHGSGCVLSSSIAAHCALGMDLKSACQKSIEYTARFLSSNPTLLGNHS